VHPVGRSSLARAGVLLAAVSLLANALGYGLTVLLARSFGPADYGALGALLGVGLIAGIPAGGLQYVLARRTAARQLTEHQNERAGLRLAFGVGVALGGAVAVLSPVAKAFFHLETGWPVVWLGAMLVPYTLTGALLGGLLGHESYGRFAAGQLVTAGGRFLAGVLTAVLGLSVGGAMAALAAAALLAGLAVWQLSGPASWRGAARGLAEVRELLPDLMRACSAIAGVIVLSNVDLLLARHFLSAEESGAYALASLFAKACLWGAQFVPVLVFPRLARVGVGRGLLLRAAAAAAGVGGVGIVLAAVAGGPIVRLVAGPDAGYSATAGLTVPFAVLGTLWALVQLALLAAVAAGDPRPGRLLWVVVGVEVAVIAAGPHEKPGQLLAVCLTSAAALIAAAVLLDLRPRHGPIAAQAPVPAGAPLDPAAHR
jgi:O-antigen/teichoic acid export membrane protein